MINIIDGGVTAQKGLKPQESPAGLKTTKKRTSQLFAPVTWQLPPEYLQKCCKRTFAPAYHAAYKKRPCPGIGHKQR